MTEKDSHLATQPTLHYETLIGVGSYAELIPLLTITRRRPFLRKRASNRGSPAAHYIQMHDDQQFTVPSFLLTIKLLMI